MRPSVLPLHIVCDIVMGEMAAYADYFVPDVTQYEGFGLPTTSLYGASVRWEATTPQTLELEDCCHVCWETLLIDVAKACELPGWGENSFFTDVDGNTWPFNSSQDYYLKAIVNLAYADDEPCDDIGRRGPHAGPRRAARLLHRRRERAGAAEGAARPLARRPTAEQKTNRAEDGRSTNMKPCCTYIYNEKRALSNTGFANEYYSGGLTYNPQRFADMSLVSDHYSLEEYPLTASESKPVFRSITRLADSPIMRGLCATNHVRINDEDAAELGIADGDLVRAVTPAGDVTEGIAMVRGGQVKGAFSVCFGYEHINYGAQPLVVDDVETPGDPAIAAGTRLKTMLDPTVTADDTLINLGRQHRREPRSLRRHLQDREGIGR